MADYIRVYLIDNNDNRKCIEVQQDLKISEFKNIIGQITKKSENEINNIVINGQCVNDSEKKLEELNVKNGSVVTFSGMDRNNVCDQNG